jgi:hypothetical protein
MSIFNRGENKLNKFFDTAIGKSVQTLLWTLGSYITALALADLGSVHWSDRAVALGLPGLINLVVYSIKVFADKEVPNLPSSVPMQIIPADQTPTSVTPTVNNTTVITPPAQSGS